MASIAHLRQQRDIIQAEVIRAEANQKKAQQEASRLQNELKRINNLIAQEQQKEPNITDHAVVRYFERVYGFNMDEIRAEILNTNIKAQIKAFCSGRFPSGSGWTAIVKQNTIISIITNESENS